MSTFLDLPVDVLSVVAPNLSKTDLLHVAQTCRHLSVLMGRIVKRRIEECERRSKEQWVDEFVPPPGEQERRRQFSGPTDPTQYYDMLKKIHFSYTDLCSGVSQVVRFYRGGTSRYGAVVTQKLYGRFVETSPKVWILNVSYVHNTISMWDGSAWGSVFSRDEEFEISIQERHCSFSVNPDKYCYILRKEPNILDKPFDVAGEWKSSREFIRSTDAQEPMGAGWAKWKK
jgi:hypothetical protein